MKKLFSLLLAGLMIASLAACSDKEEVDNDLENYRREEIKVDHYTNEKGETFYFDSLDSETITITKYEGQDLPHAVEIPAEMEGKKVAGISDMAFYSLSNISEVIIPDSITVIGDMAFAECRQLTKINIPASVESIGDSVFWRCASLETVTFAQGSKITELPKYAFKECASLKSITVFASIEKIGDGAFHACTALESVVIEEGVKTLGAQAFQDCDALASVTLPASLVEIGAYNFLGSEALYLEGITAPADSVAAKYIATLKLTNKPAEEETPAA